MPVNVSQPVGFQIRYGSNKEEMALKISTSMLDLVFRLARFLPVNDQGILGVLIRLRESVLTKSQHGYIPIQLTLSSI